MGQEAQVARVRQQYRSINSLNREAKATAVKDLSLNPFLFDDPFDGLTNSLYRWTQEAPKFAEAPNKLQVASQYYDEVLAPLYERIGTPMAKDIWMRNAWSNGLSYKPEQSYHSDFVHGLLEGPAEFLKEGGQAGKTVMNLLGMPIKAFADSFHHGDYTGITGFQNLAINFHNRVKEGGVLHAIEATGEDAPGIVGAWGRFDKGISDYASFWHDVTPNRTFTEKATSFVAESAMMLPLYIATGSAAEEGVGLVIKAGEGVPYVQNLT